MKKYEIPIAIVLLLLVCVVMILNRDSFGSAKNIAQTVSTAYESVNEQNPRAIVDVDLATILDTKYWKETGSPQTVSIARCEDGKTHDPSKKVRVLGTGRSTSQDLDVLNLNALYLQFVDAASAGGWAKCTPQLGSADYYSNDGPNYRETFVSPAGKLLQIDRSFSPTDGNELRIQYEE